MKPVLIYLRPLDQRAGQRIDVRVADGPNADTYGVGGVLWEPAVLSRPRMSIELMSPDMDGRVQAGTASFEIALGALMTRPQARRLYWKGASVVIHNTGALEGSGAIPDFWGYVTSANLDEENGRLSVTAQVSTALIDKPLLTGEFTGGGGVAGEPAKRGVLFPAGFGYCRNIQPVWFDTTRNIGMIDGYKNTLSIDWLAEGLSSFGARVADYPNYAALAAAIDDKTIKPGQWGTCVAEGLVGLGAPPTGIITVHARFGSNRIGAIMKRILLTHAKVPAERVDGVAFDMLDIAVPADVHFWTDQQRGVKDLLEALAQSCNATPLVSFQNMVTVTRAVGGPVVGTLDRSGSIEPRVTDWQRSDSEPPYYLIKGRGARPASVLTDDQVNYVDTLEDKGVYAAATVYRAGNMVWLADGSQWLYQNDTPAAGHTPPSTKAPDANGYVQDEWWFRRQPPKTASDFAYKDGTPIEALKPRQSGADPTAANTAAAISGQAPAATDPSIQPGATRDVALTGREGTNDRPGYYLDNYPGRTVVEAKRPSALGLSMSYLDQGILTTIITAMVRQTFYEYGTGRSWMRNSVDVNTWTAWAAVYNEDRKPAFGTDLLESLGGPLAGLNAFKTVLGIASGISGQGALATLSQLALGSNFLTGFGAFAGLSSLGYGSPMLTGFGALAPLGSISFGSNFLLEQPGGSSAGLDAFKTILGIASAITGQAPAATDSSIAPGATRDVVTDTRDVNSSPSYYRQAGRVQRLVMEFKRLDVIVAPDVGGFGTLETYASWPDRSGGPVSQRVTDSDGRRFIRYSNGDDTAWTAWQPEYSGNRKPFFGADLLESAGGPLASLSGFKTSLGVASGFAGQGIFATSGPLGRTSIFNGFFNADTFGLGSTLTRNNGAVLTESDAITSLGTSAGFIGQGWGATAAQNKVDNSYSAAGVNVIPNSDQALRKTWRTQYNPNGAVFISQARYASDTWGTENYTLPGKIRNVYTHQDGVASGTVDGAGDGAVAIDHVLFNDDGSTLYCPCAPGDRFIGSVYIASHRCNFQLIVSVVNRSFQQIAGPSSGVATATNNDTNVLAEPYYKRAYVAFDVPAGGAYLALIVRKYNTYGGSPNSFIWFAAPMLERGKPNQNEPSPYSPGGAFSTRDIGYGGDLDATNTGRNTASGIVGQSAWATYASLLPNLVANQVQNLSQAGMLGATKITDTGATSGRYLSTYFPVTTGADKTGNATAAAIAGQGGLATKTKADFGQDVSNIPFAQITSNYFPMGAWTAGQGMNQPAYGLSPNVGPDTYYNFIVVTTGPGGTSQNILKMTSGTSGAGEGGFNHTVQFNAAAGFSAREGYRFSIWAYREGGATGALYFGLQSEPAVYNAADGSGDGNPYFWAGTIPPNKWYLIVGMVQGSDQGNADSGLSGVYDPDTGYRVQAGSDYRLHPSAAWVGMRAYQFYTSGAGSTSYFARPRIERVSEGLPTVASMMSSTALRNADQKWSQVGNDNGGRPAEGADVTRNNTAAGFSGQTAWATLTTTTAVVQKFRSDGTLALGSGGGLASEGYGEWVTNSSAITRFGTAAAIAGQGSFATQSTISSDSQLSGFMSNRLKPYGDDPNYLSASRMAWDDGGNTVQAFKPGEPGSNKTETRTAAAIAGQGGLATRSTVEDGFLSGNLAQRLAPWGPDARYLNANAVAWASGNTVEGLKPEEAGGNRTEGRTAAALAGQSYLATNYPSRLQPSPQHGEGYLAASAMAYAGGYTVENLRPGEAGANVTETRTASAIVGQSGFATASGIGRDRLFSAGFFALNAFSLGYSITRSDGQTTVTESMTITQLGVAAGFVGQGGLASRNNINFNDIVATGRVTSRVNGQGGGFELDNTGLRSYTDSGILTVEIAF